MSGTTATDKRVSTYERAQELAILDEWFDEAEAEIAANEGEVPQHLHDLFVAAFPAFKERIEACASKLKGWAALAQIRRQEAQRLAASAKTLESRGESMKGYIYLSMKVAGEKRIEGKFYNLTRQPTQGTVEAPLLTAETAKQFPAELVRERPATYEINKEEVHRWHSEGKPLPEGIKIIPGETVVIR